jgi:hypothetical protein
MIRIERDLQKGIGYYKYQETQKKFAKSVSQAIL